MPHVNSRSSVLNLKSSVLALAVIICGGTVAHAEMQSFKAVLKASEEVPPNASAATGNAEFTYDTTTKKLSYKVSYSGLTGSATAAHVHGPAEPGKNASVVFGFDKATSPIEGTTMLTEQQAADLVAGKMYVNVHTQANKEGEIRGQILK
jgi:CHRD domain